LVLEELVLMEIMVLRGPVMEMLEAPQLLFMVAVLYRPEVVVLPIILVLMQALVV
jgi:hypothetical protein